MLVGESLMRSQDIASAVRTLLGKKQENLSS
jgi:indole-3-glycerol phosphate synthase